jgi:type II secretory pathway component PulF
MLGTSPFLAFAAATDHNAAMLFSIAADERAAMQMEDLAAALEAGLKPADLGGDPGHGDGVVTAILQQRGVRTTRTEQLILAAGWRAGRIGAMLRGRAAQRQQRAEVGRTVWSGLRYPVFLIVFASCASVILAPALKNYWMPVLALAVWLLLMGAGLALLHAWRTGGEAWLRLPILGPLLQCAGELPYLETLHGLYASGIAVPAAHLDATRTVPIGAVRRRLEVVTRLLQEHGGGLAEALARAVALHPETRSLLQTGELAGQLEETLERILQRRRQFFARSLADAARWLGVLMYGLAAAFCISYVAWVYSSVLSGVLGR